MSVVFGLADRISVMVHGRIVATGTPAEIRANAQVARGLPGSGRQCLGARSARLLRQEPRADGVTLDVREGEIVSLLGRNAWAAPPP